MTFPTSRTLHTVVAGLSFSDADERYFSESLWLLQWREDFVGFSHTNTARLFGIVPVY